MIRCIRESIHLLAQLYVCVRTATPFPVLLNLLHTNYAEENYVTDIRTAILQAADHIERNPWALEFSDGRIPSSIIYARVCPLAWIGFFAGMGAFDVDHANAHDTVAAQFLKLSDWAHSGQQVFYQRMTDLCGYTDRWRYEGGVCAQALRAYADQYHPATTTTVTGGLAFINKIKTMIESEQIQERIAEEV